MVKKTSREILVHLATGILSGVAASTVFAILGFALRGQIASWVEHLDPTCQHPTGLTQLTGAKIDAVASSQSEGSYAAANAIDGNLGTMWIPPIEPGTAGTHQAKFVDSEDRRTLVLALSEEVDVELVCVNNGLATDPIAYQNWGRLHTVEGRSGDDPFEETTLQSFPVDNMQQMQSIQIAEGATTSVELRVVDSYIGSRLQTFDPSSCGEVPTYNQLTNGETAKLSSPNGCIRAPFPRAGISEVLVYTQ